MEVVSKLLESFPDAEKGLDLEDPEFEEELDRRFVDKVGMISWESLEDSD